MGDKLTNQDKRFVKKVVETGNLTLSAQEAYDIEDPNYAGVKGHRLIKKDKIVKAIQTLADSISDERLQQVLEEGLDATREDKPDYLVRHKYLDTALKLKGAYSEEAKTTNNILMPVLVKFLDKDGNGNRDTNGI